MFRTSFRSFITDECGQKWLVKSNDIWSGRGFQ